MTMGQLYYHPNENKVTLEHMEHMKICSDLAHTRHNITQTVCMFRCMQRYKSGVSVTNAILG